MKKLLFCAFFALLSCSIFAQGALLSPTWKVKSFGMSFSFDEEMLGQMDHKYFLSTVRGNTDYNYSNLNFDEEDVYSMACENPNIRLNLTLLPPAMRNVELNLALIGIINRVDYVSYQSYDRQSGNNQSMTFDLVSDAVNLEVGLMKRFPLGRTFNFYTGLGTNMGVTTGGSLSVWGNNIMIEDNNVIGLRNTEEPEPYGGYTDMESLNETYSTKTAFSQRVFAQAGFSFAILQRLELGAEYRRGIGYRAVRGAEVNGTQLHSVGFNLRWLVR